MTKEEALVAIDEMQQRTEELKAFVAAHDQDASANPGLVARRFITNDGKTGVYLSIPQSVPNPSMPIMEYLMRDFIARGGKMYDAEFRIKRWSAMRFSVRGRLCDTWEGDCAKTFGALPKQPTVGDLLGQSFVWLVDTNAEIETHANESFDELMDAKVDVINPMAFMALFLTVPDITDPSTYPSFRSFRWEWVAAVDEEFAANGDSLSGGLRAGWGDPEASHSDGRARPAVR